MAKELKVNWSYFSWYEENYFCESCLCYMWVLVQWTQSIPNWTNEVVLYKQLLFSAVRHLVIGNYLEWVKEPKHFIKQYFFLFLSYCICCFSTTTLILKCFSWHGASHERNKLVESSHMPITIIGLLYTHWNVWFTGISHRSSYHQAAKTSWFVCAKTIQGLCA